MRNNVKNIETKLPLFGINIRFWLLLAGLAVIARLIYVCGATISTVAGIYLGYKVLRLILRLFGLIISLVFTLIPILIMIAIISLIII